MSYHHGWITDKKQVVEINGILYEILEYNNTGQYRSEEDYMPLLPKQTHETGDTEHKNNCGFSVEGQGMMPEMGSGRRSSKSFWHNTGIFSGSQQKCCNLCGPKLGTISDMWVCFRSSVTELLCNMSYKHAWPQITKSATPLTFHLTDKKWKDMTAGKVYVMLALFVLVGI